MAYYSQVYNDDGRIGPKMYPEVFHYAYGVNDVHMLEDWDAKAGGEDLAGPAPTTATSTGSTSRTWSTTRGS